MKVLGVMSGTSLDGLDLALVEFQKTETAQQLQFKILEAVTRPYEASLSEALKNAPNLNGKALTELDVFFGKHIGIECKRFLQEYQLHADAIASHGHTVFHEPEKGYTLQIGNGLYIAEEAGISCIYDFRTADVAQGGQGAPLVPIGDLLLFPDYDCCVNLGGIANLSRTVSFTEGIGYDVCPFNIPFNYYSEQLGVPYDADGAFAKSGLVHTDLLSELQAIAFYQQEPPKSLDKEWILRNYLPLIDAHRIRPKDVLATLSTHFAMELTEALNGSKKVLLTGGGAFNTHFVEQLQKRFTGEIHLPSKQLIECKEALVFALLGYLRYQQEVNILSVITGGKRDISSGIIVKPST